MAADQAILPHHLIQDMRGKKFHQLTVLSFAGQKPSGLALWNCQCDCGKQCVVVGNHLRTGNTKSCGCRRLKGHIKHGRAKTPEWNVWQSMIRRCKDPSAQNYCYYGGRGIQVCERWRNDFLKFLEDMGPRPTPQHSIDRINNDGPYEPGNCRWATLAEQHANKRGLEIVTYQNETLPVADWARKTGIPYRTLKSRFRLGWTPERALTQTVGTNGGTRRRG